MAAAGARAPDVVADVPARALTNAHAERFVRSIKHECLDRLVPLGERHFRRALSEFVEHYHRERSHQGLGNRLIDGRALSRREGGIHRRQRLGDLLNYYERVA
jgi:transposase InsO family protein